MGRLILADRPPGAPGGTFRESRTGITPKDRV